MVNLAMKFCCTVVACQEFQLHGYFPIQIKSTKPIKTISLWILLCLGISGCVATKPVSDQGNNQPAVNLPETPTDINRDPDELAQARLREDANLRRLQSTRQSTANTSTAAVVALREKAETALLEEDAPTANLLLERALRIDPSDPATYLQLARLRLADQEYSQAGALAKKGLSLNPAESVEKPLEQILLQTREQPAQ